MITSAGVGSGLDIESILSQLMEIEREPINALERKKDALDVKISALGSLKSAMSELESSTQALSDTTKFGHYQALSDNEEVFSADTSPGTSIENHTIEVLSLAKTHQIATDAYSGGPESTVKKGTYDFSVGDESFEIDLKAGSNSLLNFRDAINDAEGNTSISASVLNLDGGSRLILTARSPGTANEIDAPKLFDEIAPAEDATARIDGFSVTSASNTISDAIPGVTLDLKSIGTGKLETSRNTESFRTILDEFVGNYNTLISSIDSLSEGDLSSDGTLRSIKSDLSRLFFESIPVKEQEYSPFDLGLTFDRDGILSINESVFSEASSNDTENFIAAMSDPVVGFGKRVIDSIERYTDAEGLISVKEDSFDSRMRNLDAQTERLEYRLEQTETRHRRQFTALDTLMSQLQSTSSYLTDQLQSINLSNNS